MDKLYIPGNVTQLAICAVNDAKRASVFLTAYTTASGLIQAEAARKRAIRALRDLAPRIRAAKAELKGRA